MNTLTCVFEEIQESGKSSARVPRRGSYDQLTPRSKTQFAPLSRAAAEVRVLGDFADDVNGSSYLPTRTRSVPSTPDGLNQLSPQHPEGTPQSQVAASIATELEEGAILLVGEPGRTRR